MTSTYTAASFLNMYQAEGDGTTGNPPRPEVSYIFGSSAGAAPTQQFNGRSMIECTVDNIVSNNTISAAQNILSGSVPAALTGSTPSGGIGAYTYAWISSTTGPNSGFSAAAGTNNTQNYTPGTTTVSTWYRRIVSAVS